MASPQRCTNATGKCPHAYAALKGVDLECFETPEEKISDLLERCTIQEKERKLFEEEIFQLEEENHKLELRAQQLKMKNYQLEADKDESERAYFRKCHALKCQVVELKTELEGNQDRIPQAETGSGGQTSGNLLNSVGRTSGNGNHSAQAAAQSVSSNERDLKARLEIAEHNLKIMTDKNKYLEDLIVKKLALAEQASRQANEVPMAEAVAREVRVARVLPVSSTPPPAPTAAINHQMSIPPPMNGNTANERRSDDEDNQVVPTG